MKKITLLFTVFFSLLGFSQNTHKHVANEIIVKFETFSINNENLNILFKKPKLAALHTKFQVTEYQTIRKKNPNSAILIKFNSELNIEQVITQYQNTGYFKYVEPNYIAKGSGVRKTTPNDSEYYKQWSLKNDGTFANAPAIAGADIEMEPAWDIEKGDPNMIVAVIDSGLRLTHPEFSGRIWQNTNEVADGTDTDNNGFIDDLTAGWDFINNDNNPTDDHGHGTNVAGIVLASGNNAIGYAGVNWNSRVMICKALNSTNSGSYAAIAGSIYYAVDNGAKVISMSIGGSGNSVTLSDAIDYCYNNGVVLVACMMNFNNNVNYYPAAYTNVIAVGSTDPDDKRSNPFFWSNTSGSNYGNHIDLVAPGNYMYGLSYSSDTNYGSYWGGTSQATPLVSGVVSLLLAQKSNLTFEQIRTILRESAEDQVGDPTEDIAGFDIYYGYGRLNAKNALNHYLLGTNTIENNINNVTIFPNPIKNRDVLKISNLSNATYTIQVYTILGQSVFYTKTEATSPAININLPNLKQGVYLLKLSNITTNSSISKKLIIK